MNAPRSIPIADIQDGGAQMRVEMSPDVVREYADDMAAGEPDGFVLFDSKRDYLTQIEAWNLPTRPTKKTDTRSKTFKGGSVEADAIPPADLRALVEEAITQHIDKEVLRTTTVAEESERELLRAWVEQLEARQ